MNKELSCGTIILNNNQVLLIKQKKSGTLNFPKGHMNPGETEIETAIRETKEETNLDVLIDENKRFELTYPQQDGKINKTVVYFIAKLKYPYNNIILQTEEIETFLWVDIDKVFDTLTYDNLRNLWKNVLDEINN